MKTVTSFASLVSFAGKTGLARATAFASIPHLASQDVKGRAALVAAIKATALAKPTPAVIAAIKTAVIAGRTAGKLDIAEDKALELVVSYVAPREAKGGKVKPLPAGKLGERSELQHRAIRSAEQAWSQLAAEAGIGTAKNEKEVKKAKRAAHHNAKPDNAAKDGAAPKAAAPDHSQLVTPASKMTADDACQYLNQQAATLLAFANKYAKVLPTDFGTAVHAFKGDINKAMNAKATRDAIAAANK